MDSYTISITSTLYNFVKFNDYFIFKTLILQIKDYETKVVWTKYLARPFNVLIKNIFFFQSRNSIKNLFWLLLKKHLRITRIIRKTTMKKIGTDTFLYYPIKKTVFLSTLTHFPFLLVTSLYKFKQKQEKTSIWDEKIQVNLHIKILLTTKSLYPYIYIYACISIQIYIHMYIQLLHINYIHIYM